MHLAYATSPLNPFVPPSGGVMFREGSHKIFRKKNKGEKEDRNANRKTKCIYKQNTNLYTREKPAHILTK